MAHIRLENVTKQLRRRTPRSTDLRPRHRRRRVLRAARPDRRRQDDDAAPDRRAREADRRLDRDRRRGRRAAGAPRSATWRWCLQQYSLYPRYTVRENLDFPLKSRVAPLPPSRDRASASRAPRKTLRIEHLLDRKTDRLSGGEMQRVSIGRAIVREPQRLPDGRAAVEPRRQAARGAARRAEGPADEARRDLPVRHPRPDRGDVDGRQDRRAERTAASSRSARRSEIYNEPRDAFVASFVGSPAMNLIEGELRDGRVSVFSGKLDVPYSAPKARRRAQGDARHPLGGHSHRPGRGDGSARSRCREPWRREDRDAQGGRSSVQGDDSVDGGGERRERRQVRVEPGKLHCFDAATGTSLAHA